MSRPVQLIAGAIGAFLLVVGIWAFASPQSFYDTLATFPPYNKHLFHDVGSFQIGLGLALLLPILLKDMALAALTAVGAGMVVHAISHVMDRNLGGKSTDPYALGALALVVVVAAVLQYRHVKKS